MIWKVRSYHFKVLYASVIFVCVWRLGNLLWEFIFGHYEVLNSILSGFGILFMTLWLVHLWVSFDQALGWDSKILTHPRQYTEILKAAWCVSGSLFHSSSLGFFPHILFKRGLPHVKEWVGSAHRVRRLAMLASHCSRRLDVSEKAGKLDLDGLRVRNVIVLHDPGQSPKQVCPSPVSWSTEEQHWWRRKEKSLTVLSL